MFQKAIGAQRACGYNARTDWRKKQSVVMWGIREELSYRYAPAWKTHCQQSYDESTSSGDVRLEVGRWMSGWLEAMIHILKDFFKVKAYISRLNGWQNVNKQV